MKQISIKITELRDRYETMEVRELADYYDITTTALYKLLDEAKIPRKINRRPNRERVIVTLKDQRFKHGKKRMRFKENTL